MADQNHDFDLSPRAMRGLAGNFAKYSSPMENQENNKELKTTENSMIKCVKCSKIIGYSIEDIKVNISIVCNKCNDNSW